MAKVTEQSGKLFARTVGATLAKEVLEDAVLGQVSMGAGEIVKNLTGNTHLGTLAGITAGVATGKQSGKVLNAVDNVASGVKSIKQLDNAASVIKGVGSETQSGAGGVNESRRKTKLDYVTSSGLTLEATPGKTTTVLGTYANDTANILDELGNIKSMDFGPRDGSFNLLNTPDEIYNQLGPENFWTQCNKPWLDNAIERGDIIKIATEPTYDNLHRINNLTGEVELSGFGREIEYLKKNGYIYDSTTKSMIKD